MAYYSLGQVIPQYLGEWNNVREYNRLDIVSYLGSSYICGRANKNVLPTEQGYDWTLLAAKGEKGDTPTDFCTDFINGGIVNVTKTGTIEKVYNGLAKGGVALCFIGDSSGLYPSAINKETRVNFNSAYTVSDNYLFSTDAKGANVGDLLMITKQDYLLVQKCALKVIPLNDAKVANSSFAGTDGIMTVWDKERINKVDGIEWTANNNRDRLNNLMPSVWAGNMDDCLESGVYPWCTLGRPKGADGAFTCVVKKSTTADSNGYYTIEQTAYGRENSDVGEVWKRLIFRKDDGTKETLQWVRIDTNLTDIEARVKSVENKAGTNTTLSISAYDKAINAQTGVDTLKVEVEKPITTSKIEDLAITTEKIDTLAITTDKIAHGAVDTSKIEDNSVTTEKIADGAITTSKLGLGVVTSSNIMPRAITKTQIDDDAVTSGKIKDGAITTDKLSLPLQFLMEDMQVRLDNIENADSSIYYLGEVDQPSSAYKLAAQADIVKSSKYKILCYSTSYGKCGTIFQNIFNDITTQYIFYEGKTRCSYMRTFNSITGAEVHGWKQIHLYTDYKYSNGTIYGYTAGLNNIGEGSKEVEVVSLSDITDSVTTNTTAINTLESNTKGIAALQKLLEDNSEETATDLYEMYMDNKGLVYMYDRDVSNVTSLFSCFQGCSNLLYVPTLNTEKVTAFNACFSNCTSLVMVEGLDMFAATNVTNMFYNCTSLDYINIINLGYQPQITSIDFSSTKWGWGGKKSRQSVVDTLLTNSLDRVYMGFDVCEVKLPARTMYQALSAEQRTQITNKGYTLTAVE